MKPLKNIFGIASLFEQEKYISVCTVVNGMEAGHLYKQGNKYIASGNNGKATMTTLKEAIQFIKTGQIYLGQGARLDESDTRGISEFEIYLTDKITHIRKLWTIKFSKRDAEKTVKFMKQDYPERYYKIEILPIYKENETNKNQIEITY